LFNISIYKQPEAKKLADVGNNAFNLLWCLDFFLLKRLVGIKD